MRKFFRYLLLVLADSKKLPEALNKSKTSLELDSIAAQPLKVFRASGIDKLVQIREAAL